jgi:hypothetical protein
LSCIRRVRSFADRRFKGMQAQGFIPSLMLTALRQIEPFLRHFNEPRTNPRISGLPGVTILDHEALQKLSCECYAVSKMEFDRLLGDAKADSQRRAVQV